MKTKILFLAFLAFFFSNSNAETWSMNYCKIVNANSYLETQLMQ